ncbi:hypothetical protein BJ944DRAFT_269897 [Cunninghamella echinulata]|nr:hypothetical protein BJ944DRAFT_269897 [Cunninghamella echinulata]
MKKLFGKKKKSGSGTPYSMESDYQVNNNIFPRKLKMSKSMEQPRKLVLTEVNVNNNNGSKDKLTEDNINQDMKNAGATVQSIMAKRLNRPTSSPPSLVMPRPRYAVPPTRAVLKSYENEKTQLDPDTPPNLQVRKNIMNEQHQQLQRQQQQQYHENMNPEDNVDYTNSSQIDQIVPTTSTSAPILVKSKKTSPILSQTSYHDNQINEIKKSVDNTIDFIKAKKHESMYSISGSDDSNRIYETAVESPLASASTATFENNSFSNSTFIPILQNNHHISTVTSTTTSTNNNNNSNSNSKAPIAITTSLLPINTSDSSETVTPAGSILYQQQLNLMELEKNINKAYKNLNTVKPIPRKKSNIPASSEMKNHNNSNNHSALSTKRSDPAINMASARHVQNSSSIQQMQNNDSTQSVQNSDLETLQQQVKLIQQQREADRAEFERLEQLHIERTKKMREEIERTQNKLLQLSAAKQDHGSSSSSSSSAHHHHHHHLQGSIPLSQEQIQDIPSSSQQSLSLQSNPQRYPENTSSPLHEDNNSIDGTDYLNDFKYSQANNNTSSKINKYRSADNMVQLSRNSSKSSNNGSTIKIKKSNDKKLWPPQQPTGEFVQSQNNDDDYDDQIDSLLEEQLNSPYGKRSTNPSQASISGRRSQQPSRQSFDRSQQPSRQSYDKPQRHQQDFSSLQQQAPRTRTRQHRPRSKSTDAQPPVMEWESDYYTDPYENSNNEYQRPVRPSSRPKSNNSNKDRQSAPVKTRSQRSRSIDQPYPPFYEYPPYYGQPIFIEDYDNNYGIPIEDGMDDEYIDDRFLDMDPRYQQQLQQRYDSFPPRQPRHMRHSHHHQVPSPFPPPGFPPPPHFMAGPIPYMSPSTPTSSSSSFNNNNNNNNANRSRMNPARMNMEMQQAANMISSEYENPSYYTAIPPSIRRQPPPPPQQQQQPYDDIRMMHGMMIDDDYWKPSPTSSNNNNRYPGMQPPPPPPPPPFINPPYVRMGDPSRYGNNSNNYWRNRPPPSS